MGIFEYLTVFFVGLKLTGIIHWTWWQVFSPAIIAFSAGFIKGCIKAIVEHSQKKMMTKAEHEEMVLSEIG